MLLYTVDNGVKIIFIADVFDADIQADSTEASDTAEFIYRLVALKLMHVKTLKIYVCIYDKIPVMYTNVAKRNEQNNHTGIQRGSGG